MVFFCSCVTWLSCDLSQQFSLQQQMIDSERFGKRRSSFALNAAQGWKRKKKKKSLFHQGHRTSVPGLLYKEQDGNSKTGSGGTAVNQQSGEKRRMDGACVSGKKTK